MNRFGRKQAWAPAGFVSQLRSQLAELPRFSDLPMVQTTVSLPDTVPDHATARRRRLTPEGETKRDIERALKARGWRVQRQQVGAMASGHRVGVRGDPDFLVRLGGGKIAYLEIKRSDGKGRTSEVQERRLARLRSEGYIAEVVSSVEEAVAACERALDARKPPLPRRSDEGAVSR